MSDYVLGYWRPLFQIGGEWVEGIQYATGKAMPGFGVAAEQNATIVRIDLLNTPGLQFYTTAAGDLAGRSGDHDAVGVRQVAPGRKGLAEGGE